MVIALGALEWRRKNSATFAGMLQHLHETARIKIDKPAVSACLTGAIELLTLYETIAEVSTLATEGLS